MTDLLAGLQNFILTFPVGHLPNGMLKGDACPAAPMPGDLTPLPNCPKGSAKPETIPPPDAFAYLLADLAIILIAARIVGGLFVKMKQPRVVGEIIAGILIGPTILGGKLLGFNDFTAPNGDAINGHLARGEVTQTTDKSEAIVGHDLINDLFPLQSFAFLNLIGTLTLVFFMFLVGLEVQQRFLKGKGPQILAVALAVVAVPVALGFLFNELYSGPEYKPAGISDGTQGLILGAALAVTAFPVMARILQEKRQIATPMGAIGVGAAAVVTPLMFLILAGAAASAKGQGALNAIGTRLLLALALAAFAFFVFRPFLKNVVLKNFDEKKPLSGEIFAVLLVAALLGGLAGDRIGIHALNGAFIVGAAVPQITGLGKAVIDRMGEFVVVFMIPIFLAVAGLQTDFTVLKTDLIAGILVFLGFMIAGKWFVGAAVARMAGLNWKEANTVGVLMNCRGLMILIVAIVAGTFGGITPEMRVVFALGAIITTMMTGPLVDVFLPKEAVDAERDKSIKGSIAGLAAMTGGPRVVIAPASAEHAGAAVASAVEQFIGKGGAEPQFLVANLPGLAENGDYVGAVVDGAEQRSVTAALGWLGTAADRLAAAGVQAEAVSFQTPEPNEDLAKLATDWAATDAVVTADADASALEAAGVSVHRVEA
ncbi:MAG TPA: cation:proton antiporter [Thermoleophilaceae bacterium]|nr:cation:proton antiporter [Thermoleophilaceae bacterium]